MPRLALDWRFSDIDIRSVSVLVDALGHELKRLGLGTVEKAKWMDEGQWKADPLISSHPIGGYHHMGTTRMGSNARTSVTDSDGRVPGIANLYVAGSSLFPTGSWPIPRSRSWRWRSGRPTGSRGSWYGRGRRDGPHTTGDR